MICLADVNENNFEALRRLDVAPEQRRFLDSPLGILARGYVYRTQRARVLAVLAAGEPVSGNRCRRGARSANPAAGSPRAGLPLRGLAPAPHNRGFPPFAWRCRHRTAPHKDFHQKQSKTGI